MIDDTKEYIACSAIHYDNGVIYPFMKVYGIETGFVLAGLRHPFIASILPTNVHYEQEPNQSGVIQSKWEEGDIDSEPVRQKLNDMSLFLRGMLRRSDISADLCAILYAATKYALKNDTKTIRLLTH